MKNEEKSFSWNVGYHAGNLLAAGIFLAICIVVLRALLWLLGVEWPW